MTEHERIWLEPAGAPDRCWCQDNQWGDEGVEYVLASTLESLQRENERLRQFLFPYADRTDISGISWDGKYLIGDKASIKAFHELKNRGEQIDVYKRAYDQNEAALKARAETAETEVKRMSDRYERWMPVTAAPPAGTHPDALLHFYCIGDEFEGEDSPEYWKTDTWGEKPADAVFWCAIVSPRGPHETTFIARTALASTGGEHHAE